MYEDQIEYTGYLFDLSVTRDWTLSCVAPCFSQDLVKLSTFPYRWVWCYSPRLAPTSGKCIAWNIENENPCGAQNALCMFDKFLGSLRLLLLTVRSND